jgi:type VI secretion system protein VasG
LSDSVLAKIVRLQLSRIEQRIHENHKIPFTYDDAVVNQIVSRCTEYESGGRMIDSILTNTVLPRVSTEILSSMMEAKAIQRAHLSIADGEFFYEFE